MQSAAKSEVGQSTTRRDFLSVGALTPLGISLSGLLESQLRAGSARKEVLWKTTKVFSSRLFGADDKSHPVWDKVAEV